MFWSYTGDISANGFVNPILSLIQNDISKAEIHICDATHLGIFSKYKKRGLNTMKMSKIFEPMHQKTNNLLMRKKAQTSFGVTAKLINVFVFATWIVRIV